MNYKIQNSNWIIYFFIVLFISMSPLNVLASNDTVSVSEVEEITLYANLSEEILSPYLDDFARKYPNIKVHYICLSDYENEIKVLMETGDYGDLLYTPGFVDDTYLLKYFEPLGEYDELSQKYNYVNRSHRLNNTVYSLPSSAYLSGIAYNKNIFCQAGISTLPKSIDEFYEDMEYIKDRTDAIPMCSNYANEWALYYWTELPFLEMTGDASYKGNQFIFEKNPYSEGSTFYQVYSLLYRMVKNGLVEPDLSLDWGTELNMLNTGELGCAVVGSWALKRIKELGNSSDNIGFMPFPNEVNGKQYMTISTDYCYSISKQSKHKEAAKTLLTYLLDESGFALNEERVSILKTDPFPNSYGNMQNIVVETALPYPGNNYFYYSQMAQAFNPNDTSEIKRIITAGAGLSDESFDDIINDWNMRWESARPGNMSNEENNTIDFSEESTILNTSNYEIKFSQTEKNYITSHPILKVGYLENMAPFQYVNYNSGSSSDISYKGISSSICDMLSKTTNCQIEYKLYPNSDELIQALDKGQIDFAAGLKNSIKSDSIKFSTEYISFYDVIISSTNINIENLVQKRQAIIKGEPYKLISPEEKQIVLDSYNDLINCLDTLKADYAFSNYYSAEYYLRSCQSKNLMIIPLSTKSGVCFAFPSNCDSRLISICNKCILSIPNDQLQIMLISSMEIPTEDITFIKIVKAYPIQSIIIILVIILIITIITENYRRTKIKNMHAHALDMKRYETLAQLMDECVFEYDLVHNIIKFDKNFDDVFGFFGNISIEDYFYDSECINQILEICKDAKLKDSTVTEPIILTDKNNNSQYYKMLIYRIQESDITIPIHLIGKVINVQTEIDEKQKIQEEAEKDSLTNVWNRKGFEKKISNCFGTSNNIAVAILDYDNFKSVNDTLGHTGGDEALKILANELLSISSDTVFSGRYGGDEFLICIINTNFNDVKKTLGNFVNSMNKTIFFQGKSYPVSISLGAVWSSTSIDYETMLKRADEVLYSVKENGKNGYQLTDIS